MFEQSIENQEKPKEVYIYKIIEETEDKEEKISFAWRADFSMYFLKKDSDTNQERRFDDNAIIENVSDGIKKLGINYCYHEGLKGNNPLEISTHNYKKNFNLSEELIRKIEEEKNQNKKEGVLRIRIENLTEQEIEEFQD